MPWDHSLETTLSGDKGEHGGHDFYLILFCRFIQGGALAIASHLHHKKENSEDDSL